MEERRKTTSISTDCLSSEAIQADYYEVLQSLILLV